MKKNKTNYYAVVLFMLLIISIIFTNKTIYLAPNLNINMGLTIYPFTYLVVILMYNTYNTVEVKKTIYINFLLLIIFYIIISILNSVNSLTSSQLISDNLRNIFTPNYFNIGNIYIYYPNLINLLTFSLVSLLSHYIFIATYEAIESTTNYIIAFILAILIGFILDQMLYTPLTSIEGLINNTITYNNLIELMTANFIVVIFTSVILLFIYAVIYEKRK